MKILGLYNNSCALPLFEWLEEEGHVVVLHTKELDAEWCINQAFDLAVSYTYRYIVSEEILSILGGNVVNIHNSYLPWNRGADPNIWSIVDQTPRGVTLHYMDAQLDKGYIIAQKIVGVSDSDTFAESYNNLDIQAKQMFQEAFMLYRYWPEMKKKALGKGSYHSVEDGKRVKALIDTYDMTIREFKEKLKCCSMD